MSGNDLDVVRVREQVDRYLAEHREQMWRTLQHCICSVTRQPIDDVTLDQSLIEALGFDSIDLMGIVFAVEEAFGVPFDLGRVRRRIRDAHRTSDLAVGISDAERKRLRILMPEVSAARLDACESLSSVSLLFTTSSILRLIAWELIEPEEQTSEGHEDNAAFRE